MTTRPRRPRITQYAKGYQTAMHEILDIADRDGPDAALTYARNNAVTLLDRHQSPQT